MHIPENYLSPSTCAVFGAAMLPVWWMAVKKVKEDLPREKIALLGAFASFSFLAMMFNLPLPGGTTGHAVGSVLLAILFGPWAACLAVSLALFVQALFFGDGGLLAFGANAFNMALLMPFGGALIYQSLRRLLPRMVSAAIASYAGLNLAALMAAIEFGVQPLLFTDGAGHALYAPYPLSISIPAMMLGHLTLFGLAEAFFTCGVLAFLTRVQPELVERGEASSRGVWPLIGALIALSPLGLLAAGTAWGEWSPGEIAEQTFSGAPLGYTPAGMEQGFSLAALFPDYALEGLSEPTGYILSACIGTALLVILFKLFSSFQPKRADYSVHRSEA